MKPSLAFFFAVVIVSVSSAQTIQDLFTSSGLPVRWLGIDYSQVQLVGDFSQFGEAGQKSAVEIRNRYFPGWNGLVVNERAKYDLQGMLRKDNISYEIEMISEINSKAPVEDIEVANAKTFFAADIERFVKKYNPGNKEGIGVLLIAETLDKTREEAWYHFVAINLSNNKVLLQDRLRGKPSGIGLRNYWAGSFYDVMKGIEKKKYKEWKSKNL